MDHVARGQCGERFIGQVEKFGMRIVVVGQIGEQFRDVVAGIQPTEVPGRGPEPPHELGLGHQVECLGRFVEEDYSTMGEYVKSRLEGVLEPPCPLGQSADFTEFPLKSETTRLVSLKSVTRSTKALAFSEGIGRVLAAERESQPEA